MLNLTYAITTSLQKALDEIEELRIKIALYPLTPEKELQYRWESMVLRSKEILSLENVEKGDMQRYLNDIIRYQEVLYFEYTAAQKIITAKNVCALHSTLYSDKVLLPQTQLKNFLDFIQIKKEHPVIQSSLVYIQLLRFPVFTERSNISARLLALLFLYNAGYDFRGLLVVEEIFNTRKAEYAAFVNGAENNTVLNAWITFYARCIIEELKICLERLQQGSLDKKYRHKRFLNDRQKEILTNLINPESSITNKKVQEMFGVSQLTASRELSKMVEQGLLRVYGKGRSVYYSRI
jgi:uncharacterized membrane protein